MRDWLALVMLASLAIWGVTLLPPFRSPASQRVGLGAAIVGGFVCGVLWRG